MIHVSRFERPFRVIDAHAHVLPYFGSAAGFASPEEHHLYMQRAMHTHGSQPVRRARDHAVVREPTLWDPDDPTPGGRYDVDFRVGRNGRFEWTKDGEDYYLQFMPVTLQTMEAPVQFHVDQMDAVGVDASVLQNDHIYGSLNAFFADAVAQHPQRFLGCIQVEEARAFEDAQIARLRRGVEEQGLRGLYFTTSTFFTTGYRPYYDEAVFEPFWREVEALDLPVFWVFPTSGPIGDFAEEMRRFRGWYERHPALRSVLVHGVPDPPFLDPEGRLALAPWMVELFEAFPLYAEILYPLRWGGVWDYPYPQAFDRIRMYRDMLGSERLVWGSDMPNVERYCSYRQALTYLTEYCDFLSEEELRRILSENALSLFRDPFPRAGGAP